MIVEAFGNYRDGEYTRVLENGRTITCKARVVEAVSLGYNKITVESPLLDEDGKIDPDKLRPITFDPIHNAYRVLGEKVGNAFQDGAKLK